MQKIANLKKELPWMLVLAQKTITREIQLQDAMSFFYARLKHFRISFTLHGLHFPQKSQEIWELARNIFLHNEYDLERFELKETSVIVDVGAHQGAFVALAATITHGDILAFEPEIQNFSLLKTFIEKNHLSNVKAFNTAIGASKGQKTLYLAEKSTRHSLYSKDVLSGKQIKNGCTVEVVTLDEVLKSLKSIDLLKLDCEGAEIEIIRNTSSDAYRKINAIIIEYHGYSNDEAFKEITNTLYKEGYKIEFTPMAANIPLGIICATKAIS